ncbi:MAG: threonine/serine exporter ThrE family protein [Sandaracinaceae bacterium]
MERSLDRLARALGLEVQAFATPTAILATLSDGDELITQVVRVEPGGTDLERLSALNELVGRVERHELTPGDAKRRLDVILARPPRYGATASMVAYGLVSVSAAALLGGSLVDLPVAAGLGVLVGIGEGLAARFDSLGRLLPALGAALASFLGTAVAAAGVPVQPSVLLLAAVVVLLPGFTLTTAMLELASAHLVSGMARLAAAAITFLQLAFGIALGRALAQLLGEVDQASAPSLPEWTLLVAPVVSALGFGVLLKARPSPALPVLASGFLALLGSRVGGQLLGAELGAFVGAFLVAAAAHLYARRSGQPVTLMLVPGILFMVPGSVGFLSLSSLIEQDVQNAVITAFRMCLIAMALAAGLLAASAAIPSRRAL